MRTLVLCSLLVSAGCAVGEGDVGTVDVPLTTTLPDGSTYRLIAGAQLAVTRTAGMGFYDQLPLDGDASTLRFDLPPGDYQAQLLIDGAPQGLWPMERADPDGNVEVVWGTLLTQMPAPFTVTQQQVTPLALAFVVPRVGPVQFGRGHLDVSVSVEEDEASSAQLMFTGTLAYSDIQIGSELPAGLAAKLPAPGTTDMDLSVYVEQQGPWSQTALNSACAEVTLVAAGADTEGILALVQETAGTPAQACLFDGEGYTNLQIFLFRDGAANTETFQAAGDHEYQFVANTQVQLDDGVYDGATFHPETLTSFRAVPATFTAHIVADTSDWYLGHFSGELQFSLRPYL